MIKNIIKYGIIVVVLIGIVLVIRNIINNDNEDFEEEKGKKPYYDVTISLVDKDNGGMIEGAELVIKNEASEIIEKWTTTDNAYVVTMLPKGKYTLEQMSAGKGYKLNEDVVEFTISDKDLKLVMYNTLEGNSNGDSDTQQDVPVVDTLSIRNPLVVIVGTLIMGLGVMVIFFRKKITG